MWSQNFSRSSSSLLRTFLEHAFLLPFSTLSCFCQGKGAKELNIGREQTMRRLFYASEVVKACLSPEASFRLQILLLPQIPNWHCSSKRKKKGQAEKEASLQTGQVVYPTNWRRLSEELATKYMWEPVAREEGFDHIFISQSNNV